MNAPLAVVLLSCVVIAGCGPSVDRSPTASVSGIATYNGEPVEGATVSFVPTEGRPASATTDDAGRFDLTTFERGDGAVLGNHEVLVVKQAPADPDDPYAERPSQLPAKYAHLQSTPLEFTVTEDGFDDLKLELVD